MGSRHKPIVPPLTIRRWRTESPWASSSGGRPPRAWVALAAATVYAIVAFAAGGEAMWLSLAVPPLLLLSGLLWLRWLPAAWAGAVLALVIALLGFGIGPLVGGVLALIGVAAFVSELPHLHHPHVPAARH